MSRRVPALAVAAGGLAVMLGASLPWLTLFAGLQSYRGLIGLNGKLLFLGGAATLLAGATLARGARPLVARVAAGLGGAMAVFAVWLLVGLRAMVAHGLGAMLVPRVGPGLFVVLAGAGLVTVAAMAAALVAVPSPNWPYSLSPQQ